MVITEFGEAIIEYNDPKNLVSLLEGSCEKYPNNKAIGTRQDDGSFTWTNYSELKDRIDNFRGGLVSLGLQKDDSVGIITSNRLEWVISAFATYGAHSRFIAMYENELLNTWKFIIRDSEIKILIVSNIVTTLSARARTSSGG